MADAVEPGEGRGFDASGHALHPIVRSPEVRWIDFRCISL
jgi:hypothetical protein